MSQPVNTVPKEEAPVVEPRSAVKPGVAAHVIAVSELDPGRAEELEPLPPRNGMASPFVAALADAHHPLRRIRAKLTVCVGTVELSVGELLGAREHQVLRLDRTVEQPVDVMLEGQVVARGVLVAVDDHFAVRITDLPVAFEPAAVAAATHSGAA